MSVTRCETESLLRVRREGKVFLFAYARFSPRNFISCAQNVLKVYLIIEMFKV